MNRINLARNTTFYTGALTFQKILAFFYFWFISNNLLADQLGQYVFALSFTTMFSIFIDLGLSPILTREAAKNPAMANTYLKNVIGVKLPLSLLTLIAAWLTIYFSGKPPAVQLLVYLASFIMLLDSFSLSGWVIFRSRHNLSYESVITVFVQLIIFILGLIALKLSGQVKYLLAGLLVASLFNLAMVTLLLKFKLKFSLRPSYDSAVIRHFLSILPAFALAGIFVKIYNTSDSVLLSYLDSDAAVGYFAVPAKVVYAFQQIIPAAFAAVIFPTFSYYYAHSQTLLKQTFERAFVYLTIVSWPIAIGLITVLPQAVAMIWPDYLAVVPCFYVMISALPFIFLAFPTGYLLNSCDRQNQTTLNRGIITVLAVVLNIILIPRLSFFGAGLTFFVTNFFLLLLDFYWVRNVIKLSYRFLLVVTLKTLLACAAMVAGIWLVRPYFGLMIEVALGAGIYFVCLYALKGLNLREMAGFFSQSGTEPQDLNNSSL